MEHWRGGGGGGGIIHWVRMRKRQLFRFITVNSPCTNALAVIILIILYHSCTNAFAVIIILIISHHQIHMGVGGGGGGAGYS